MNVLRARPFSEAQDILLGCAPGLVDQHVIWAAGVQQAWHAVHIASAWDRGVIVDTDDRGGTLSDGKRWRMYAVTRRVFTLHGSRGTEILTIRQADIVKLVGDPGRFAPTLVDEIRTALAQRKEAAGAGIAAWSRELTTGQREPDDERQARERRKANIERRCELLAQVVWNRARPSMTLFDALVVAA
ncbi:hypothetical protein [Winogradskya humida]|uniref:Uncharacterized protein n=1 Tax=Winogradskya humida TaxID=113566 RepID=A0ABQ4A741_9ACTN|nr:hypothetical protein [Actinoplanes humidus]GIE26672.1 hypothetical protein Ahu01nite_097740 [Actinoplanes humidus]